MGKKSAELGNNYLSRKVPHWTEKVRVWTKKRCGIGHQNFWKKKVPNWTKKVRNRKPALENRQTKNMLGQVKESLKKFRLARLSVPNFSFLAYLEVSRLVKLARLARLVRVG